MSTPLRVVTANLTLETADTAQAAVAPTQALPSLAERIQHLQFEAKTLARDHVEVLRSNLLQTQLVADQIAQGGDAYPPGVRELAARLVDDAGARAATLEAIMGRA
jgi:hypothetical protein